ncbi:MAG: LamG domain-containing protein, partial [Candidatus Peribacteraceae bacterium]|nr:LamG domain-containing protein [Candidatus Peribacteraceae bacterium]
MTLLLFLLSLQPGTALAATRTWDGGGSTSNWSEDANWSDDTEPTAADTALFDATDATNATVDSDILIGGLTVTSGYGGTLNLGSATITGSVGDGAVQFTAADKSWLTIADASQTGLDPGTSDFSISGWVKPDTTTGTTQRILYKGAINSSSVGYNVSISSAMQVYIEFDDSVGSRVSTGVDATVVLSPGTWYFITVNFTRVGNVTLYINGVSKKTVDISALAASVNSSEPFVLGADTQASLYRCFNGVLDSFSFSSRILTADEITWLYNSGNGRVYRDIGIAGTNGSALKTNLVSWWDLGENAGTRYDSYGTNHLSQSFANIIAPPVYGSEKVSNTGFETVTSVGPPANFALWGENTGDGNIEVETTTIHGGTNALKLTGGATPLSAPNIGPTDPISVTAGATYRLSFWTAGDGTNAGRYGLYNVQTGDFFSGYSRITTGVTGATYSLITVDFVVPAGCTSMRPYFYAPNVTGGIAYFDDVSLKQITTASINNGGFEDWTTATNAAVWTESVAGTSTVNREDAAPYSGTNAARFDVDASNSLALINQVGIMSVGKLYTYTSYAKASDTVTLRIGDTSGSTNTHTLTTAYSQYSGSIRATSTYFGAYSLSASSNSIYLDSVTLTAAEILGTTGIPRGRGPTVDYAGQFNGTSQYLSYTGTAFNPGTGDFSVGASFYLDKTAANIILFSSGTPGDANDAFYINRDAVGRIQILLNDSSGASFSATTTGTTSVGRWYTVVVNFDRDGNCTVSLNGAAAENLGSISGKLLSIDPGNFFVGRYASTNTLHFPGRINGAFYANRLLTSNEITYLHNNGKWRQFTELGLPGTNGSSLTSSVIRGFWDMDTAGNLGLDSTTNANNLTNNGTVTQGTGNSQYTGGANFTFDQPGTLNLSSATVRVTDGTFDVDDAGTLTPGSSTLELNGISTLSGSTTQSLHNVKILTGAVVTQRSAVTMDGTFTSSGSYAISSGNLSVGESLYLPGTFTHGNATVTLTGAGSAAIDTGGNSLYALTLNGGGAYDLLDTLTVTSALTLAGSSVLD